MARRLGILVVLMALLCGAAMSQEGNKVALDKTPPSRAQVLALMSAMGVQQGVETSIRGAQSRVKAAAHNSFKKQHPEASDEQVKKLDAVFDSTPMFGFETISESLIGAYQKNLSGADVQAAVDFYNSEAGKNLLAKIPVVLREANEAGGAAVQARLKDYAEVIQQKLDAFQAELPKPAETPADAKDKPKSADEKSK